MLMLISFELHKLLQARAGCMFFVAAFLTFMSIGGFPSFVEDMKVGAREWRCMKIIQGSSLMQITHLHTCSPKIEESDDSRFCQRESLTKECSATWRTNYKNTQYNLKGRVNIAKC